MSRLANYLPALLIAALAIGVGLVGLRPAPAQGEMAVVFSPWTDATEAHRSVVAAGGSLADSSRFPNIIIAYSSDPGFADRVRQAGAWFLFAATGLCGPIADPRGSVS